jgi:hypothetical protein
MRQSSFFIIAILLGAAVLIMPAFATQVLTSVAFTPNAPLVPGGTQEVVASYTIIPSGSTTFSRSHSLQMQTGLLDARWNIQMILNGRNAAQQSASGSAAFVNGVLLSYPTDNDVSMTVTIQGTVPPDASGQLMVMQVEEIDNTGNIVPGSTLTINQPVTGESVTPTTVPVLTPDQTAPSATPTKTPGFTLVAGIIALGVCIAAFARRHE